MLLPSLTLHSGLTNRQHKHKSNQIKSNQIKIRFLALNFEHYVGKIAVTTKNKNGVRHFLRFQNSMLKICVQQSGHRHRHTQTLTHTYTDRETHTLSTNQNKLNSIKFSSIKFRSSQVNSIQAHYSRVGALYCTAMYCTVHTVPIQKVSMVEDTEDCSLFAIRLSPHTKIKGADGSGEKLRFRTSITE